MCAYSIFYSTRVQVIPWYLEIAFPFKGDNHSISKNCIYKMISSTANTGATVKENVFFSNEHTQP
jgi:hypothetical protein